MNNYNYTNLPPFKWFVLQNFPFIEADFDALTNWQLFCKLGKEINKVIAKLNLTGEQVESLTNAFNDLETYVNNYFENLDIQAEVDAKLDDMVESGTLAEIINQEIFTELNNKVLALENTLKEESKIHFIANTSVESEQSSFVGDCVLITGSKNVLVDVGNQTNCSALINYLQAKDITKLDYVIITHYHNDHIGGSSAEGLLTLISQSFLDWAETKFILPHKNINYSRFIPLSETNVFQTREQTIIAMLQANDIAYEYATEGQKIDLSDTESLEFHNCSTDYYNDYYNYTIDAYGNDVEYTNYNNFSLITMYKHFDNVIALTGDIEKLAESNNYQHFINVDLLKIEHHGLNCESDSNYLKQLNPKFAVICNSQYYNNPADYAHPTTFDVTSKGAKLFTTRNANETIVFGSRYNGIIALNDSKSGLGNMQYDLWSGQEILNGDDLNNYTIPGIYNSNNSARSQSLLNVPINISGNKMVVSGFKLIVENLQGYNNYLRQTILTSNDSGTCTIYVRDTIEGTFENVKWRILTPSMSFGNMNTAEIDSDNWWKVDHTSYSNRIIKRNGIVQLNISTRIDENVAERSVLLEIPDSILKTSSQSAYFNSCDATPVQVYTNGVTGATQIKNSNAITSGTTITVSMTLISEE